MDVYFDIEGLSNYLKDLFDKMRRNNVEKPDSIFTISTDIWEINKVLTKQKLYRTFWPDEDFSCRKVTEIGFESREPIMDKMKELVNSINFDDVQFENDFREFTEGWIKFLTLNNKMPFRKIPKSFEDLVQKHEDENRITQIGQKFRYLSSIVLGNCDNKDVCCVDLNDVINRLQEIMFVDKESTNKTFFTRTFENWDVLKRNSLPAKDIIVVDRYLFSDPNRYECNIYDILEALIKPCDLDSVINVVLIADMDERNNIIRKYIYGCSIEDKIKSLSTSVNVTFVSPKNNKRLHDRFIITNQRIVTSGHSFAQYFNVEEGKKKFSANGSLWLNIGTLAQDSNEKIVKEAVAYIQSIIDDKDNNSGIIGDCKSNLIDFNGLKTLGFDDFWKKIECGVKYKDAINALEIITRNNGILSKIQKSKIKNTIKLTNFSDIIKKDRIVPFNNDEKKENSHYIFYCDCSK